MKNLLIIIFLACSSLVYGQTKEDKLQQLFESYYKANKFNGSVLISREGKLLLNKGYGFKNFRDSLPNDPNTIFQLGSITKQFTAAAILKLQEDQKLDLQDKISKYFPGYPQGDNITIEHLLTHTSGIYNYTDDRAYMQKDAVKASSQEKMLALFKDKPLGFAPGTKWSYSNSGYSLLGYIIEKAGSMPYEQYVREAFFNPLKMSSSGFDFARNSSPDKARGYSISLGQGYGLISGNVFRKDFKESSVVDSSVSYAAGAIYSTTTDLYKWHQGLSGAKVLRKSSIEMALTPYKNKYGYGWNIDTLYGKKITQHAGGIFGFSTFLVRIPEDDVFIVLLNNAHNIFLKEISRHALAIIYEEKKPALTSDEAPVVNYAYVGYAIITCSAFLAFYYYRKRRKP